MRATAQLSAATLTLIVVLADGCGSGGSSSSYTANPGSESGPLTITCTPISGQQATPPYFVGQTLQCSALSNGNPVDVRWSTSAGAIDRSGMVTRVTDPVNMTVSAALATGAKSTSTQNLDVTFAKPVGAPGLIFSTPIATGSAMWDFVIDDSNQIYGAGWSSKTTPNAELFSIDFWSRQPRKAATSNNSLLTAAALIGKRALFGGGAVDTSSYRPLLVSSDSTPNFLTEEECPTTGMLTALTFDSTRGVGWGAWSGDTGASRIRIDQQSYQLECSSANPLVASTSTQTRVPWIWSIHATAVGTIAAGHYTSGSDTVGVVKMSGDDGKELANQEFPGLADVRVTPAVDENGIAFFYLAGHDITNGEDVWTLKKLAANLEVLWTRPWRLAQGETEPLAIIPDPDGGVILAGKATQLAPTGGDRNLTDAILTSVDESGNPKWGPIRINPSNSGTDACVVSSVRLTPDSKFFVAAVNCGQSTINSYLLGFALP